MQPISRSTFEERIEISISEALDLPQQIEQIIALRNLHAIQHIVVPTKEYLHRLLRKVPLAGDPNTRPYEQAEFELRRNDPGSVGVCQTFILQRKLNALVLEFRKRFRKFTLADGFAKQNPFVAVGKDDRGVLSLAHYMPPIIEMHEHRTFLDGTHRSALCRAVGTTAVAMYIRDITAPLPCTPLSWEKVVLVEEKPHPTDRYQNLNKSLFRDLGWVGIDG